TGSNQDYRNKNYEWVRPEIQRSRQRDGNDGEVVQHRRGRPRGRAAREGLDDFLGQRPAEVVLELLASHHLSRPPSRMYLISRNSSMPYFEPSRPRPDCLTPPKGATSVVISPLLTPTIPYSSASATRQTRPMSRE